MERARPPIFGDEPSMLLGWLVWHRGASESKCEGLGPCPHTQTSQCYCRITVGSTRSKLSRVGDHIGDRPPVPRG